MNELKLNEVNLTSPEEIAEGFNDYFSNIGPKLAQSIGNFNFEDYIKQTNSEFSFFKTVENSKVHKLLLVLSISKAVGVDKISGKILKIAASAISPSLRHILNYAIINSSFPSDGKLARVLPPYENGPRNLPGNYRPISVLPVISKVFERILNNQLNGYLTNKTITL